MVRSGKSSRTPKLLTVLLAAFDKLRDMINSAGTSEDAEMKTWSSDWLVWALSYLPDGGKGELEAASSSSVGRA